jgi:hypothetical protein
MEHYTRHTIADLRECVLDLHAMAIAAPEAPQQAVREKYSSDLVRNISRTQVPRV